MNSPTSGKQHVGWDLLTASAYEAEEDADFVMETWGFHATAMDEWDCQNGISKAKAITIDLDTPKGCRALARIVARIFQKGR